tara:strand:+ start:56 stop:520 length:465 start_codon:yes stop_codon:yes gene_type:complete
MDIFNPTLCLAKELKSSWCQNIEAGKTKTSIPIEIMEGVPRLKMVYDRKSPQDWFAAVIPTQNSWEPSDLSKFNTLSFNIYIEEGSQGLVRFEDCKGKESNDFKFNDVVDRESCSAEINLKSIKKSELNMKSVKLIKFIGYKDAAFYISEVSLQ